MVKDVRQSSCKQIPPVLSASPEPEARELACSELPEGVEGTRGYHVISNVVTSEILRQDDFSKPGVMVHSIWTTVHVVPKYVPTSIVLY